MGIITYKNDDRTQLTTHFNVREWKCKCGKKHDIKIHSDLPPLLEKLMEKIGATVGNIYSGYRCATHDKNVGGNGSSNRSHGGYAVDIIFLDKNKKPIPSKTVALALEDLGHKYGIGYRCGGGSDASGQTHIDVKPRKWYGDESKSMSKACCSSFYDYFGIKKNVSNEKPNIMYQGYDNKKNKWLGIITNYNNTNMNGYSGNLGNSLGGIRVKLSNGAKITIKTHIKGGSWLSNITKWDNSSNGYSGIKGKAIDGVCIKADNHKIEYRVHTLNGKWLGWISKFDSNDWSKGVAGIKGKTIDAIQIRVVE